MFDSPTQGQHFGKDRSMGLPGHSCSRDKGKWANYHLKLTIRHCAASLWFCERSEEEIREIENPYSVLDQSKPAGHNKAPVRSWWNPRSVLTLRANGGLRDWPRGVIQSRIALFKLFVSSDLALAEPFCIYHKWGRSRWGYKTRLTNSPICSISSVEASVKRFWSPGIMWSRWLNTRCSRCSLVSSSKVFIYLTFQRMYSCVKAPSGWSPISPIRSKPLLRRALIVHKAWTVRPKCLPWWTRGSVPQLPKDEPAS